MSKILITAPTAEAKSYCFEKWLNHLCNIKWHGKIDVVLFDNSNDVKTPFTKYMNEYYNSNHRCSVINFKAIHSSTIDPTINNKGINVIEKMCKSHNHARDYFLKGEYTHLLHLETDVMIQPYTIESLFLKEKPVVGAVYHRDEGTKRRVMVQYRIFKGFNAIDSVNLEAGEQDHFIDGSLKEVSHIGLGCVLIQRKVMEKIKFRFVKGDSCHPDSFFAEDCFRNGFKIWADTSQILEHDNRAWDIVELNKW